MSACANIVQPCVLTLPELCCHDSAPCGFDNSGPRVAGTLPSCFELGRGQLARVLSESPLIPTSKSDGQPNHPDGPCARSQIPLQLKMSLSPTPDPRESLRSPSRSPSQNPPQISHLNPSTNFDKSLKRQLEDLRRALLCTSRTTSEAYTKYP